MRLTITLYTYTDDALNDSQPAACELEIEWRHGVIERAYLGECSITPALAMQLLGGVERGSKLIRELVAEERMAS